MSTTEPTEQTTEVPPRSPLKQLSESLVTINENFGRLITELENERFYREEARKRTRWERWRIIVVILVGIVVVAGLSILNNRVINSIKDCTTAPAKPHADSKDFTCYERALARQGESFNFLRQQTDDVVKQRNEELLDAIRNREQNITFGSLPPIVINNTTTGTTTTTTGQRTTTTATTVPSSSSSAPSAPSSTSSSTSSTTSTTCAVTIDGVQAGCRR